MSPLDLLSWIAAHLRPIVVTLPTPDNGPSWLDYVSALGGAVTAAVAVVAVWIARSQLRHAKDIREDEARPYVVVGLRSLGPGRSLGRSLYVANLGKTAAYDVQVAFTPPLTTAQGNFQDPVRPGGNPYAFPDTFPVLVPGQTWANFWDTLQGHDGLPSRYEAVVTMKDSRGKDLPALRYVIDWDVERAGRDSEEASLGDVTRALRDIERRLPRR